jgi:chemotaxis protein MotB
LKPEKFSIQAYGEFKPKYDNTTEEGRARNRRVEIFIVRKYQMDEDKDTQTENKE